MQSKLVRYRLLGEAFIDGQIYKGGEIVEKPIDWHGPKVSRQGQPEMPLFRRLDEERSA